jgi:hypothetical protein
MTSSQYAEGRRVVVIHEDDVGMTHGSNTAFAELLALGTCSAGSVMALPLVPRGDRDGLGQSRARSWRASDTEQ